MNHSLFLSGDVTCDFENNNTCRFSFGDHWKIYNGTFTYRGVAKLIYGGHKTGKRLSIMWKTPYSLKVLSVPTMITELVCSLILFSILIGFMTRVEILFTCKTVLNKQ